MNDFRKRNTQHTHRQQERFSGDRGPGEPPRQVSAVVFALRSPRPAPRGRGPASGSGSLGGWGRATVQQESLPTQSAPGAPPRGRAWGGLGHTLPSASAPSLLHKWQKKPFLAPLQESSRIRKPARTPPSRKRSPVPRPPSPQRGSSLKQDPGAETDVRTLSLQKQQRQRQRYSNTACLRCTS